ncbi:MAG: hypothetical protein AAGB11_16365 [Pseudomonadota bacterium]
MVGRVFIAILAMGQIALVMLAAVVSAQAHDLTVRDAKIEVVLDEPDAIPREREMVLATLRGTYDLEIALEKITIPRMPGVDWVQLTRDAWRSERVDGRQVRIMERRIAFFPQTEGEATILPIHQELTLVEADGGWVPHVISSPPVTLTVAPKLGEAGAWWMPAKMVELSDKWNKGPGQLSPGETVVRRITLWVLGATSEMLPPQPPMREPWLITFQSPEKRTTELTWGGPISTVTWEWTFQPTTGEPGVIPGVTLPFFDTLDRKMHDIELLAAPIAVSGFGENVAASWQPDFEGTNAVIAAGVAGALLTLLVALPGLRVQTAREIRHAVARFIPSKNERALRQAARTGDTVAFRRAAVAVFEERGLMNEAQRMELLAPLDREIFGAADADRANAHGKVVNLKNVADQIRGSARITGYSQTGY